MTMASITRAFPGPVGRSFTLEALIAAVTSSASEKTCSGRGLNAGLEKAARKVIFRVLAYTTYESVHGPRYTAVHLQHFKKLL